MTTKQTRTAEGLRDAAERLREIREEIATLAQEAYELLEGTDEETRAKGYWFAQVTMALDDGHGYLGRGRLYARGLREGARGARGRGRARGGGEGGGPPRLRQARHRVGPGGRRLRGLPRRARGRGGRGPGHGPRVDGAGGPGRLRAGPRRRRPASRHRRPERARRWLVTPADGGRLAAGTEEMKAHGLRLLYLAEALERRSSEIEGDRLEALLATLSRLNDAVVEQGGGLELALDGSDEEVEDLAEWARQEEAKDEPLERRPRPQGEAALLEALEVERKNGDELKAAGARLGLRIAELERAAAAATKAIIALADERDRLAAACEAALKAGIFATRDHAEAQVRAALASGREELE